MQRGLLHPLLFLPFVNDTFEVSRHGSPLLLAGDIKIVYSFETGTPNSTIGLVN